MSDPGILSWAGLDISFQRIGRAAWSPGGILRSWALAPWRTVQSGVAVACLSEEALWLGLSTEGEPAAVRIESQGGRWSREIEVTTWCQLGWVESGVETRPIALRRGCGSARFRLRVARPIDAALAHLGITLLAHTAWEKRFGPLDIKPAAEPPPVARYSRIIPPEGEEPPA